MDLTSAIWIVIGLCAGAFGLQALVARFVRKTPDAVNQGAGYVAFGTLMVVFGLAAIGMGIGLSVL